MFVAACSPNTSPVPPVTPTPQPVVSAHFIPNWADNDTLVGDLLNAAGNTQGYDTIYTKNVNDTSFIISNGIKYYIWVEPMTAFDTFVNNQLVYHNICISPTTNKADAVSMSTNNGVYPSEYMNDQGNWQKQKQVLTIGDWQPAFKKVYYDIWGAKNIK